MNSNPSSIGNALWDKAYQLVEREQLAGLETEMAKYLEELGYGA